jgi:hypothetical protein
MNSGPKGSPRRARGLSLSKAAESEAFVMTPLAPSEGVPSRTEVEGNREGEACPPVPLQSGVCNALE